MCVIVCTTRKLRAASVLLIIYLGHILYLTDFDNLCDGPVVRANSYCQGDQGSEPPSGH